MTDTRKCTCHPDDNPPIPCARKYALHDCLKERIQQLETLIECGITALENSTPNHPQIEIDAVLDAFREALPPPLKENDK